VATGGRLADRQGNEVRGVKEGITSIVIDGDHRNGQGNLLSRQTLVCRHQRREATLLSTPEKLAVSQ